MNAEAETRRTPCRRKTSTVAASVVGSLGLWMRFAPQGALSPSSRESSSTAASIRSGERPPAPKKPRKPARAAAMTARVVVSPFAISPTT